MSFCLYRNYKTTMQFIESKFISIASLLMRFSLAIPFWKSGLLKYSYFQNDNLGTLYFLFEDYNVPLLSVQQAAWLGTFAELAFPILLVIGFGTRFAALGILALSGVIYIADQNPDTIQWAAMAIMLMVIGGKKLSLDGLFSWIRNK